MERQNCQERTEAREERTIRTISVSGPFTGKRTEAEAQSKLRTRKDDTCAEDKTEMLQKTNETENHNVRGTFQTTC